MNGGSGGGGNIVADDWLTAHTTSNVSKVSDVNLQNYKVKH